MIAGVSIVGPRGGSHVLAGMPHHARVVLLQQQTDDAVDSAIVASLNDYLPIPTQVINMD